MKHILLSVLLTTVAAAPALAQSASKVASAKRTAENQLIELERQLSTALVKQDRRSLTVCGVTISSLPSRMAKCLTKHSDSPVKNQPLRPLSPRILTTKSGYTSMGTLRS